MDDYWRPPAIPGPVRAARVLLYVMAGFAVLFLVALAIAGFQASEIGALAGLPLALGLTGAAVGSRLGPGRLWARATVIGVELVWAVMSFGGLGQGDPTALAPLAGSVTVLILINTRSARAYLGRSAVSA